MFLIRLQNLAPLFHATSLFSQIVKEVKLKFSRLTLSIIAQNPSYPFQAVMFMPHLLFTNYSVHHTHISSVSIDSFHNALLEGQNSSSITLHLLETLNRLILRFESSGFTLQLRHELTLSPTENVVLAEISRDKYVSIDAQDFKRIVTAFSAYHDQIISVTVTPSQVKFSVASEEIVLTKEERQCVIFGHKEVESQLLTLHPTQFFMNLANQVQRVWVLKTTNSQCVMNFPFHAYAQFLVYYPQL